MLRTSRSGRAWDDLNRKSDLGWARGSTLHLHPRFESHAVLNLILEQEPELVPAVPAMEARTEPRERPKFVWADEVFRQFPLHTDPAPTEDQLTRIAHAVGKGAKLWAGGPRKGSFIPPSLLEGVPADCPQTCRVFGPRKPTPRGRVIGISM